jgi:hypothetical protein
MNGEFEVCGGGCGRDLCFKALLRHLPGGTWGKPQEIQITFSLHVPVEIRTCHLPSTKKNRDFRFHIRYNNPVH